MPLSVRTSSKERDDVCASRSEVGGRAPRRGTPRPPVVHEVEHDERGECGDVDVHDQSPGARSVPAPPAARNGELSPNVSRMGAATCKKACTTNEVCEMHSALLQSGGCGARFFCRSRAPTAVSALARRLLTRP